MFDMIMLILAVVVWFLLVLLSNHFYRQIHGVSAKWWAIPVTMTALMTAQRLPVEWEKW